MSEIKSQFFNGKTYSATDFVESNKNTMKDGILPNTDFFKVLSAGNMTIGVTSGRGWVQGHAFSSDGTLSFTLNNADGVLDRVDTVVIRLDLTTDSEKIECRVIKGALGGSATAPVRNGTYYDLVIAQIAVAHGTTAITSAMITDKRGDGNLCGWSGAISGDQFNFDVKADKTYCDNTFATKATLTAYQLTITNGTTKTNADRLQGTAISTTAPVKGQALYYNGSVVEYKEILKVVLSMSLSFYIPMNGAYYAETKTVHVSDNGYFKYRVSTGGVRNGVAVTDTMYMSRGSSFDVTYHYLGTTAACTFRITLLTDGSVTVHPTYADFLNANADISIGMEGV